MQRGSEPSGCEVYDPSLVGIAGSIPAEVTDVCLLGVLCVIR